MLYQTEQIRNRINNTSLVNSFGQDVELVRGAYQATILNSQKFIVTPDYSAGANSLIAQSAMVIENQQRVRLLGSFDADIMVGDGFHLENNNFRIESIISDRRVQTVALAVHISSG